MFELLQLLLVLHVVNRVPTVLEAEVLQDKRNLISAHSVIVKTARRGDEASRDDLIREYNTYQVQNVSSSKYIRQLFDVVGDLQELKSEKCLTYPSLVLECFDATLQDIPPEPHRQNLTLLHAIIRAVLSSSAALNSENLVNTDIKPDNILVSGLDTNDLTVKLGDLGLQRGSAYECQPFAMRAPEVWRGLACTRQSEVWALAALLLSWMNPRILGTSGINGYITAPIWSIAKLMQLFPCWKGRPSDKEFRQEEFEIAEMLLREPDSERPGEKRVKVMSLDEEMQALQMPLILQDLMRALLVPEPDERPSASEALASNDYLSPLKAVSSGAKVEK
ncbi:hypothetical protein BST61_g2785 [Cercospora zeina]